VPWTSFEADRWAKTKQTFNETAAFVRDQRMSLLIVYVPIKFRVYRGFVRFEPVSKAESWRLWPLPDLFSDFCQAEGLSCIDLTEPSRSTSSSAARASRRPRRSAESVRTWLMRIHDRLGSPGALLSSVSGKLARGS